MVPAERKLLVVQPLLLLLAVRTHFMKRKRILYLIPVLLIFLGAIGYGINYFNEIAFEGNESIVLVDEYDKILSFDAPSLHTALCLRQSIWRKENPQWPVCGIQKLIIQIMEATLCLYILNRFEFTLKPV